MLGGEWPLRFSATGSNGHAAEIELFKFVAEKGPLEFRHPGSAVGDLTFPAISRHSQNFSTAVFYFPACSETVFEVRASAFFSFEDWCGLFAANAIIQRSSGAADTTADHNTAATPTKCQRILVVGDIAAENCY
jgi:hypothetical protein